MRGYCSSCGAPIQGNYKFCTMCSGNPWQPSDNYAEEEMRRQDEAQQRYDAEREEEAQRQIEYDRTLGIMGR